MLYSSVAFGDTFPAREGYLPTVRRLFGASFWNGARRSDRIYKRSFGRLRMTNSVILNAVKNPILRDVEGAVPYKE